MTQQGCFTYQGRQVLRQLVEQQHKKPQRAHNVTQTALSDMLNTTCHAHVLGSKSPGRSHQEPETHQSESSVREEQDPESPEAIKNIPQPGQPRGSTFPQTTSSKQSSEPLPKSPFRTSHQARLLRATFFFWKGKQTFEIARHAVQPALLRTSQLALKPQPMLMPLTNTFHTICPVHGVHEVCATTHCLCHVKRT